ncbi:sensor histidine kinase [Pontibacillus halophilus JSM 076056 = DSM 19796]|uniref:histidine kinase n=1 Tax=Pontibacillus halophilus JSM 076056 = DSM 19796 TaxID=1385510 RepID=A0A0A5GPF8_9BACI|nr:sensor histidine kinase [Pontibacillus halophilus]KGX93020.1 sensor histidine kinase [Pontibacillus halophilus JSM 076056 = DSM 19796]
MQKHWYHIIPKNTGFSSYVWIIFCLLPFFFIFRSSSLTEISFGIVMIGLFVLFYRLSFTIKGWLMYVLASMEMIINLAMTLLFGYVYFALFLAFFIGNVRNLSGFLTLYIVHLTSTLAAITPVFIIEIESLFPQLPFIFITVIGVILLPFTIRYRNKEQQLEGQLEDANERISQLMIIEERERIARDLHDTLGQKLSMIGLKSDLAGKLVEVKPQQAAKELQDIRQTARTALKEVREMVSDMRGAKLTDELIRVQQIIEAAEMEFKVEGTPSLSNTPLLVENVLSMCLKEAATNVVKHSEATLCQVTIQQTETEVVVSVQDNGVGLRSQVESLVSSGIQGMRERLEFVNGSLELLSNEGTTLRIHVPTNVHQSDKEESS